MSLSVIPSAGFAHATHEFRLAAWSASWERACGDIQFPPFGPEHLTNSLHHLAELAAPTSRAGRRFPD
jgi:hypothetical protein